MPTIVTIDPGAPDEALLRPAVEALRAGGLVAFPTETVYGLGADALHDGAAARIFAAKGRPQDNPLIVHVADAGEMDRVAAEVTPLARDLAARWWPGPLTLVLARRAEVPAATTAGLSTVAVRVPDHPVALALLRAASIPVAAPSANRSGRPSPTTADHVLDDLGDSVDVLVDGGPCRLGVESTVVDARGAQPVILREGAVTREDLGIGEPEGDVAFESSPGTRHVHYRPRCEVAIAPADEGAALAAARARGGARVGLVATARAPEGITGLARFADAQGLARVLYSALRAAERAGVDVVVVEAVAERGIGRAVMDRLRRAAG